MKILILGPREPVPPTRGGAIEKLTLELARALVKHSVAEEVVLLATTDKEDLIGRRADLDGVHVFYVSAPIRGSMFYLTKMPQISSRMRKIYEKIKGMEGGEWVIHSVYFYNLISFKKVKEPILVSEFEHYPWIAEYLYHKPFMSTFKRIRWEVDARLRIEMAKHILRSTKVIHAVSRFQAEQISKRIPGISERIVVIPNFVNTEIYQPCNSYEIRRKLLGDREVLAGFIGRLTPHKNLHLLLMAMARIKGDLLRKLRLAVIGPQAPGFSYEPCKHDTSAHSRSYLRFIYSLIERYGLRNNVVFTNAVEEEDLPYYISSLDFLVHPSFVEAFGLVLIEAMACGKPVIAFNIPPINEIVNKNVGLLADLSISDLAAKMELMIEDYKLRKRLAHNAVIYTREKYDTRRVLELFRRIYNYLVT